MRQNRADLALAKFEEAGKDAAELEEAALEVGRGADLSEPER